MTTIQTTYVYDTSTQKQECPDHKKRDRDTDLLALARQYIKDPPSEHTIENKDLLSFYVCRALDISLKVDWVRASEEEVKQISVFQDYCCDLFDEVKSFILQRLA
jgi:hypothetical protein